GSEREQGAESGDDRGRAAQRTAARDATPCLLQQQLRQLLRAEPWILGSNAVHSGANSRLAVVEGARERPQQRSELGRGGTQVHAVQATTKRRQVDAVHI